MDEVPVVFTLEELWLLHSVIRHEMPQKEQWEAPPANLELNSQLAEAILFCTELGISEATLVLDKRMLLAIDYNVRADMKSTKGVLLGQGILLRCFRARLDLQGPTFPMADDGEDVALTADEARERIDEMDKLTYYEWLYKRIRPNK